MKAIVVGAGLGGLSAAIRLAASGWQVQVVEAASVPGGKAGTVTVDGVTFDTGPSTMTLPHVLAEVFEGAGRRIEDHVTLRELNPGFRYLYPDGTCLDVFQRREDTRASVESTLGSDAAKQFDRFVDYAQDIWDFAAPHFIYDEIPGLHSFGKHGPSPLGSLTKLDPFRSMIGGIKARVKNQHLRWLFLRYATYNGSDPRKAPATLNCIAHVELGLGGYGIEGGIQAMVRALVELATELGVRFTYDTPVAKVLQEGGRVTGVQTREGNTLAADAVIWNADVAQLRTGALDRPKKAGLRMKTVPSMSGWTAVARARRTGHQRAPHTVVFPEDYDDEFKAIFDRRTAPPRPTVYLCAQEATHAVPGWADAEPVFLMANAPAQKGGQPADPAHWQALSRVMREQAVAAGVLHADDPFVWERSPDDLAVRFPGSHGSLYGEASNSMFSAFLRPRNHLKKLPGLYLASGSAHPGGGMPLCLQSGMLAARAALRTAEQDG